MRNLLIIMIIFLLFNLFSCGIGGPAGKYHGYLNKVYSILTSNPENAELAAEEVFLYVEKNQKKIEEASLQMKELSAAETENVYIPVKNTIQKIIDYIKSHTTDEYPLATQEKLIAALQILLK